MSVARPADQALVASDEARADLHPSGFDPSRWQPIETAPVGMSFLAAYFYDEGGEWVYDVATLHHNHACGFNEGRVPFLYWQQLPEPPAIATEAGTAATPQSDAVHEGAARRDRPQYTDTMMQGLVEALQAASKRLNTIAAVRWAADKFDPYDLPEVETLRAWAKEAEAALTKVREKIGG